MRPMLQRKLKSWNTLIVYSSLPANLSENDGNKVCARTWHYWSENHLFLRGHVGIRKIPHAEALFVVADSMNNDYCFNSWLVCDFIYRYRSLFSWNSQRRYLASVFVLEYFDTLDRYSTSLYMSFSCWQATFHQKCKILRKTLLISTRHLPL